MKDIGSFVRNEDVDLAETISRKYPGYQAQVFTAVLCAILVNRADAPVNSDARQSNRAPKPMTVTEFFAKLRPSLDVEKVLVAAYFLEKHRNVANFGVEDLKGCILQGKIKPPANPSLAVLRNAQKGLMAEIEKREAGKKSWILTQTGAEAVEQMLSLARK